MMKLQMLHILSFMIAFASCSYPEAERAPRTGSTEGQGSPSKRQEQGDNPPLVGEASDDLSTIDFEVPVASFDPIFVSSSALNYDLVFTSNDGKTLFKAVSQTAPLIQGRVSISAKLAKGLSGSFSLKLSALDQSVTYVGTSQTVTIADGLQVKIALKKHEPNGGQTDSNLSIDLRIEDEKDNRLDLLSNERLRQVARNLGDPKQWNPPTLDQVRAIAVLYCDSCHANDGIGKTSEHGFYKNRRVSEKLRSNLMPTPGNLKASDMDSLKKAGFDYRDAMVRYAKSLGNNK